MLADEAVRQRNALHIKGKSHDFYKERFRRDRGHNNYVASRHLHIYVALGGDQETTEGYRPWCRRWRMDLPSSIAIGHHLADLSIRSRPLRDSALDFKLRH